MTGKCPQGEGYDGAVTPRLPSILRRDQEPPESFDGVLVLRHGRPYDPAWDRWRPNRRWPGIILSALVTAGLLVAIAYHYEHKVAPAPKPVIVVTHSVHLSPAYFPPISQDSARVQTFGGTASKFHVGFTSSGNTSTWTFECHCVNNFDVIVRNAAGTIVDVPVNTIGRTRLVAAGNYPAGSYTMDVTADGQWTIHYVDETGLPLVTTPYTYVSSGTSVLGPFSASDRSLYVAFIANLGQLLTVQAVDKTGTIFDSPVFTIRSMAKTYTLTNPPNPYYLIVSGPGLWLVKVK